MNTQELTTWQRLLSLDLDASDAALPFSKRLARENDWSESFADAAIAEYRKFCFLAVHAGHPVTPSDEVDQVWHLHMLYTRHYWDTLCRDTLGTPLHHGPTQGGAAESRKFHDWYEHTLAAYRRYFGVPPADFWPASRERFDVRNDFVRVNRRDVVTFDRARLRGAASVGLIGAGVLAMAQVFAQPGSRAERGAAGLVVVMFILGVLFTATMVAAIVAARRRGRAAPRRRRRSDDAGAAIFGAGGGTAASHCPPGSAVDAAGHCADGGGAAGGGAAAGCGGAGCGGGGGGCGGGGGGCGGGS